MKANNSCTCLLRFSLHRFSLVIASAEYQCLSIAFSKENTIVWTVWCWSCTCSCTCKLASLLISCTYACTNRFEILSYITYSTLLNTPLQSSRSTHHHQACVGEEIGCLCFFIWPAGWALLHTIVRCLKTILGPTLHNAGWSKRSGWTRCWNASIFNASPSSFTRISKTFASLWRMKRWQTSKRGHSGSVQARPVLAKGLLPGHSGLQTYWWTNALAPMSSGLSLNSRGLWGLSNTTSSSTLLLQLLKYACSVDCVGLDIQLSKVCCWSSPNHGCFCRL